MKEFFNRMHWRRNRCVVCGKSKGQVKCLHMFPATNPRLLQWLNIIKDPELFQARNLKSYRICCEHFDRNQYLNHRCFLLKKNAAPTCIVKQGINSDQMSTETRIEEVMDTTDPVEEDSNVEALIVISDNEAENVSLALEEEEILIAEQVIDDSMQTWNESQTITQYNPATPAPPFRFHCITFPSVPAKLTMAKRVQPPWEPHQVSADDTPVLRLYNSLTRRKEVFVPEKGKRVNWYSCGPTVYDASHMGHARSYITFDILRRVLTDYFRYDVNYVMNITDIDDKIIKRARQNYLFERYTSAAHTLEKILDDSKVVLEQYAHKAKTTTDPDKRVMMDNLLGKLSPCIEDLKSALTAGDDKADKVRAAQDNFMRDCRDPLSEWLDQQYGSTITDNNIFASLPAHWESEFHKDMDALNVLRPNILTRVSEYIPEIVAYIERIIANGLAYEANGSVYFDVQTFDKHPNHHYAKLVPEAYGDAASLAEGEGELSAGEEKRAATDFALWKRSKAGEPAWPSPWGMGRPGWHIECSAMASAVCGNTLDIHTGGVDLKFPHHDNEIAQSEAYFNAAEWVKYFLHSGHLTIAGCKMSKSLKNFVSIQDALARHSPRQLRFAFLLHAWRDTLDYSDNTMEIAQSYERMLNEFFLNVKDATREVLGATTNSTFVKCDSAELHLHEKFQCAQSDVHRAMCDNIDTRGALEVMRDLIASCNIYLRDRKSPNCILLHDIALYLTGMLKVYGIPMAANGIGFQLSSTTGDAESTIMPYLSILSTFRGAVRTHARELRATNILQECDTLRDDILPNVGVRLEDREDGEPSAVKLVDRDTLLREKEAKQRLDLERQAEKTRKKLEQANLQAAKDAQRRIPPNEMFKSETDKYSIFDPATGLPTHDHIGKEISKGQLKKLQKLQQAQEKRYAEYLESVQQ